MNETTNCIVCGCELIIGVNWSESKLKKHNYRCKECSNKYYWENHDRICELRRIRYVENTSRYYAENKERRDYQRDDVVKRNRRLKMQVIDMLIVAIKALQIKVEKVEPTREV